ncbi:hypothetical protein SODALDRAFT_282735 [Sodiomyces alkalinus F11]|uniref:protein-tyrosine-phosphatase n=1 Tax=Sodiomyces alkalinus (strain CBS 110278 / VKM F-3762 / F11) TaxID=1314773 RepID=A0A3N2PMM9_SODAK|nr:hypothetical protein SODALDRAFT_282735 [Sodiomyces alkalinus F11]ROT35729.1 hypothetical protein SODALDRAFT_282735 [Sodiomyces alkalinus F11]
MPSAAARRLYEDQIPSFMAVFDLDAETMADQDTVTLVNPKLAELDASYPSLQKPLSAQHFRAATITPDSLHKHNDSTSTQASESAESSPTTTLSTTDSSPLTDPSPSSSPDSPINLIPLSSFPGTSFGALPPMNALTIPENSSLMSNGRPMTSPAPRRPKNMKGLSIQPPCLNTTVVNTNIMASEPASPAFIKPTIPAMKRKPSQLSLKTSSSDLMAKTTLEVPSTPALPPILQRRALKHSTSSPHMLSGLKSATHGPPGGMTFPKVLERNESGLSEVLRPTKTVIPTSFGPAITEEDSPIRTQLADRGVMDSEPFHEQEKNEDQKSPGYPEGPLAIYDDDVFLYSEPTAEEAARFDVVINVAREVNNPFSRFRPTEQVASDNSPIPDTAVTAASFATAFEYPPTEEQAAETPTTPRAAPSLPLKQPEYIHIPWDHNTDIAPDLMRLCETIDSRTREGKKVLVHCQQGASRSASLIIAYGLYRNPALGVNDAYYAAQAKSRWISPNMKLMYCLQDFQKEVAKRKSLSSSYRPRSGRSPAKHRLTLSADAIELPMKEPRTAPLPDNGEGASRNGSPAANDSPGRARGYSTPGGQSISPGPSSAPSSFAWSEKESDQKPSMPPQFDLDRLLPRNSTPSGLSVPGPSYSMKPPPSPGFGAHRFGSPAGFGFSSLNLGPSPGSGFRRGSEQAKVVEREISVVGASPDDAALMSPRAETMTRNPLRDPCSEVAGMHFVEIPPTPGDSLFSPRETMFPRDPFAPFGRPPQFADPRSPPTTGETPIVRSIDEIL